MSKIDTDSTTRIVTLITFIGSLLSLLLLFVSLYIFVTFRYVLSKIENYIGLHQENLSCEILFSNTTLFFDFRSIQCDRLTVHKNLVTALIIHFVLMIIWIEPFITGEERTPSYRDVVMYYWLIPF